MQIDVIGSLARASVRRDEPVTVAVPLPRGQCASGDQMMLTDADQRVLPLQTRVLDRWIDGSARWVLIDFQARISGVESRWRAEISGTPRSVVTPGIVVHTTTDSVQIDTGVLQCAVARHG